MNIFPSLISGDLLNLAQHIQELEPYCAGFHIDIMDFHFVPNLTWGPDFVNAIRSTTKKQIWIDLLVNNPENYLPRLNLHPKDIISIHIESQHHQDILSHIKNRDLIASLALNHETPIKVLEPLLGTFDNVLIMSVKPGFSGQKFIPESIEKLKDLCAFREKNQATFTIAMDGGLNLMTLPLIQSYEVTMVAIASGIFGSSNPVETLQKINQLYDQHHS